MQYHLYMTYILGTMGLEPITKQGADFKSAVYTIPPSANVGKVRIELTISVPKTDVVPLYYSPMPRVGGLEPPTSCVTSKHSAN